MGGKQHSSVRNTPIAHAVCVMHSLRIVIVLLCTHWREERSLMGLKLNESLEKSSQNSIFEFSLLTFCNVKLHQPSAITTAQSVHRVAIV
jgi:hypothetical protein